MDNLNEKIYSKITAIIIVAITIMITAFCLIILLDVKQVKRDIDDLRILNQLRYDELYIADDYDFKLKNR